MVLNNWQISKFRNLYHSRNPQHQIDNSGYGFISSDEGQRFMSSIQSKERNNESERSLFGKIWSGRGDSSTLSSGTRGFNTASMSVFLPIQPQPLLGELLNFQCNDGFLDRFLFLTVKPELYLAAEIHQHHQLLQETKNPTFDSIMMQIFEDHKDGKCYELDTEAQIKYDSLMDGYSEILRQKYDANIDNDDKENIPGTQPENLITSSKDTIHILRLSAFRGPHLKLQTPATQRARRCYSPTALVRAYQAIKEDGLPVLPTARQYSVPLTTLRDRVDDRISIDCTMTDPGPVLSEPEEAKSVAYIKELAAVGYGYTRAEVISTASDFAVQLGKHGKDEKCFSMQWFCSFLSRWPELHVVYQSLEQDQLKQNDKKLTQA